MIPSQARLAEAIIHKSSPQLPADAVLRGELKAARDLLPSEKTVIAHAVFAYYRWLGWTRDLGDVAQQLNRATELAELFAREPRKFSDAELVERTVPAWLAGHMKVSAAWARTLQAEPPLWLRARPGQGKAVVARFGNMMSVGSGPSQDALEYRGRVDLLRSQEFHDGEFELQDLHSQAVGLVCDPSPGQTWWDACAGEGGKTLHLGELMQNKGLVWASDRAEWRLKNLKRRAARARVFNYRAALWNGSAKLPTKTKFDGVLLDAPCSGVGTWQRNPHARWTTTEKDVEELSAVQKQLLANVAPAVKPGGKLVYAVCTVTREETEAVADDFEKRFDDFESIPLRNPLNAKAPAAARLYLWPHDTRGNAMFIAAWRRKTV